MWSILWPIAAFSAGALITAYRGQYTEYASALSDVIKDVEFVRDKATQYWVCDADPKKDALAEVEIRSGLHQISRQVYGTFSNQLPRLGSVQEQLLEFHSLCTGGDFETATRAADRSTASELRTTAASLIVDLRREKIRVSQWKHVFWVIGEDVIGHRAVKALIARGCRVARWLGEKLGM